ncbi:MAG: ABC transporter permease [Clostridia bacterium]|nr:ABC transporter permease [Clostridia bacterium]
MKNESLNNKGTMAVLKRIWDSMGVWMICILLFIALSCASDTFFSSTNLINIVRQIAVTGIVALGATYVVLAGEIDLSQGGIVAFVGCGCAYMIVELGMNPAIAIAISILFGAVFMSLIGAVIAYLRVPSFIATLGLTYVMDGAVLLLTNSQPIPNLPSGFTAIARGYIAGVVPIAAVILLVAFIIGALALRYTSFGRNVVAVGENKQAAKLSGINVEFIKVASFAIAGACSALGGIVLAARLGSGQPSSGSDVSLMALAAVFVGGASKGSVMNTLAGTLIIGMINNGLNQIGLEAAWKSMALGLIIIVAVILDVARSRRLSK